MKDLGLILLIFCIAIGFIIFFSERSDQELRFWKEIIYN
jgi:hypothetical protein